MEDERGSRFHDENERLSRETSDDDDDGTTPAQQSASSASLTVPLPRRDRDSEPDAVSSSEPKLNSGDRSALLALNRSTSLTLPNREKKDHKNSYGDKWCVFFARFQRASKIMLEAKRAHLRVVQWSMANEESRFTNRTLESLVITFWERILMGSQRQPSADPRDWSEGGVIQSWIAQCASPSDSVPMSLLITQEKFQWSRWRLANEAKFWMILVKWSEIPKPFQCQRRANS